MPRISAGVVVIVASASSMPSPLAAQVNLGVLREDEVNIIIHGHEPTLSEMILAATGDPELIEYAKTKGAQGISLAGICCTSNETLVRQGVASAGNFLHQELAILTGAIEASNYSYPGQVV